MLTFEQPTTIRRARKHLRAADPHMAAIIEAKGPFRPDILKDPFKALVYSVVHQQLSMKAARTISGRLRRLCPRGRLSPTALAACSTTDLRAAGLSRQKADYIGSICEAFLTATVRVHALKKMPDEEVIETLTQIKGVGVWTAEMILIFSLQRADVWPVDDLGLRNALKKWYRVPAKAKRTRLVNCGRRFRPYRSIATWYLWRSLDGDILPGFQ